ncbi:MAG: hypothetical protein HOG04_01910, partial [Nitrospinaceae bacterium]|nr:hypothetical protein [Nitrospinaceae bacterium]
MRRIAIALIASILAALPASIATGGGEIQGPPPPSTSGETQLLQVPWRVAEHKLSNGMR